MTKHVFHTLKVEQPKTIKSTMQRERNPSGEVNQMITGVENTVDVKKHEIIKMKVQRRKPDPGKEKTVRRTLREPTEAAH